MINRILIALLPLWMVLVRLSTWIWPYRYARRNPARRWCRRCGQREEYYVMAFSEGDEPVGWEVMYPLVSEPCVKHARLLKCDTL